MIESTAKKISREYQENENFAPKQNERDCPMTLFIQSITIHSNEKRFINYGESLFEYMCKNKHNLYF